MVLRRPQNYIGVLTTLEILDLSAEDRKPDSMVYDITANELRAYGVPGEAYPSVLLSIGGPFPGNSLDQAYDDGGAGAGRRIFVDAGPVWLDGSLVGGNTAVLDMDGHSILRSQVADPAAAVASQGFFFAKDVGAGISEFFWMNTSGVFQVTGVVPVVTLQNAYDDGEIINISGARGPAEINVDYNTVNQDNLYVASTGPLGANSRDMVKISSDVVLNNAGASLRGAFIDFSAWTPTLYNDVYGLQIRMADAISGDDYIGISVDMLGNPYTDIGQMAGRFTGDGRSVEICNDSFGIEGSGGASFTGGLQVTGGANITGATIITGKLTVTGPIDPTWMDYTGLAEGADPAAVANHGIVYCKLPTPSNAIYELHYREATAGIMQLTKDSFLNYDLIAIRDGDTLDWYNVGNSRFSSIWRDTSFLYIRADGQGGAGGAGGMSLRASTEIEIRPGSNLNLWSGAGQWGQIAASILTLNSSKHLRFGTNGQIQFSNVNQTIARHSTNGILFNAQATGGYFYFWAKDHLRLEINGTEVLRANASTYTIKNIPLDVNGGAGQYVKIPSLTTVQRDALTAANGMVIYNSTTTQFEKYENGSWVPFSSTGGTVMTPEGGVAVRLTNKTGAVSKKGSIVQPSSTTDNAFALTGANSFDPIGVVYEDGIADGSLCLVVIGGIVDVLLEDGTASTRDYWVRTSVAVGGRADATTAAPPGLVLTHFTEIGHCLESQVSGVDVLARIALHFN